MGARWPDAREPRPAPASPSASASARRRALVGLFASTVVIVGAAVVVADRPPTDRGSAPWARALADASPSSASTSPFDAEPPTWLTGRLPDGEIDEEDGVVPDGVTVFDAQAPAVLDLDPALLDALRRAGTEAAADGVELLVNSGWRSRAYQEQLFLEAISEHGSEAEASRWVASPETSEHVSGDAVDIGRAGAAWLADHGDAFGLCRVYDNEPWHFELRPDAADRGCPATYDDPTQDPRMHPR